MSKSKSRSIDDGVKLHPFDDGGVLVHDIPRRSFVHYDNSDSVIDCSVEPSKTIQSEKDACDINLIVQRAAAGEFIQHVNHRTGDWGLDVSGVSDYQTALNFVQAAQSQFMELPAHIRARFQNNPAEFLAFIENPDNIEEGRKLGIFKPADPVATPPAKPSEAAAGGEAAAPGGGAGSKGA